MSLSQIARELRRGQTDEEKELWRLLRGRRFAGFKFRRQHAVGGHVLDFYCAEAKLDVELDGFQHGLPAGIQHDQVREKYLAEEGIETLRLWNHQWQRNREGCLLEIWNALQRRTGCVQMMKNAGEQKFIPPDLSKIEIGKKTNPSPRLAGRGNRSARRFQAAARVVCPCRNQLRIRRKDPSAAGKNAAGGIEENLSPLFCSAAIHAFTNAATV